MSSILRTAGYPEPVARLMAALCTNSVPSDVWNDPAAPVRGSESWRMRRMYRDPHLPQGAPTSPALANLCAFGLDLRLSRLAEVSGAVYTRYADDLTFSGDQPFERALARFMVHASAIALEEGFQVNARKTRVMRQGQRQHVAGVIVNVHPNVRRAEYDTLKATLRNCVTHGPETQNRAGHVDFRAHLRGRISHVASINPSRAEKLLRLFDAIAW